MATALFSTLVNRLAANAPGAPQPVLVTYIRDAAIMACERIGIAMRLCWVWVTKP